MSLIGAAFNRSRAVLAMFVFLLVAGAYAYTVIPKESEPDISIPVMYVSVSYQGISPKDSEKLLIKPLEKELKSLEGLKEMNATAYEGGANVILKFNADFDSKKALYDVREKVDTAKTNFPDEADDPYVGEVNPSLFPVLVVTVSGDLPEENLLQVARGLRDRIKSIPEVLSADLRGTRDETAEFIINPRLVESYGLNLGAVVRSVSNANRLVAAGALDNGSGRFSVKVPSLYETLNEIKKTPLKVDGDAVVTIGDIATLQHGFKDATTIARINGQKTMSIEVVKRKGQNIIKTIAKIRTLVKNEQAVWSPNLRSNVKVGFSQDQSNKIKNMLQDLQNNVLSAILLVLIVVVASLGIRSGLLVGLAIPGSFLMTILILYVMGININMVVLFSLILSVGMLVDGAIVVTEFADRKYAEGMNFKQAYKQAAKRMAWPIISSTATTLAAFFPLLFWPDVVGEFMKFLPITVIAALSSSLIMALVFIPTLGANLKYFVQAIIMIILVVFATKIGIDLGHRLLAGVPMGALGLGVLFLVISIFPSLKFSRYLGEKIDKSRPDRKANTGEQYPHTGFTGFYLNILKHCTKVPIVIVVMAAVSLVGCWGLYGVFGKGVIFFPDVEPDQAIVRVYAQGNLSIKEKDILVRSVEDKIFSIQKKYHEFENIYTTSGTVRDSEDTEDIIGRIQLEFVSWEKRRGVSDIEKDVNERLGDIAGIRVEFIKPRKGPDAGKPIAIQLRSRNPDLLPAALKKVEGHMKKMPKLREIEDTGAVPGVDLEIVVDKAQAAKFGVSVPQIGQFVQLVTRGAKLSTYRPDYTDEEVDIVARYPKAYRTITQLKNTRIITNKGAVPISNFIKIRTPQKTGMLRRSEGERVLTIKADVAPGVLPNTMVTNLKAWLKTQNFPGVDVVFKGQDEDQQKSKAFLMEAFGIALAIMALILLVQFNSFYSSILILSAVVMSTVGVGLGLLIIGQPFSIVMSGIGVVALAGIVVNNNIVLIDTFDVQIKDHSPIDAILRTCSQRLRPVMLTTITTILGLMPMVLQVNIDFINHTVSFGAPSTQWWVQLSSAIAFGLFFATLLTLIVTPCALVLRERWFPSVKNPIPISKK